MSETKHTAAGIASPEQMAQAQAVMRDVVREVNEVIARHAMSMPGYGGATVLGIFAARQILEETVVFARANYNGERFDDPDEVELAVRQIFGSMARQ